MKIRQEASRYAMLVLGAAILAFGLYNVHSQSHITEGGVLGMTLLLEHWLGISPAISEVVLDGICYAPRQWVASLWAWAWDWWCARAARQAETMRWRWSSPKSWDGGFPWPIWQRI